MKISLPTLKNLKKIENVDTNFFKLKFFNNVLKNGPNKNVNGKKYEFAIFNH